MRRLSSKLLTSTALGGGVGAAGGAVAPGINNGAAYSPTNPITGIYGGGFVLAYLSSSSFVVPEGVTKVRVRVWGSGRGGGPGAGFTIKECVVAPGQVVPVTVAPEADADTNGSTSSFGTFCSATGGTTTPGNGIGGDLNVSGGVCLLSNGYGGGGAGSVFGPGGASGAGGVGSGGGGITVNAAGVDGGDSASGYGGIGGRAFIASGGAVTAMSPGGAGRSVIGNAIGMLMLRRPEYLDFIGAGPGGGGGSLGNTAGTPGGPGINGGGGGGAQSTGGLAGRGGVPGGGGGRASATENNGIGAAGLVIVEW